MKRKHFILALVAMLWSFSFSAFADDVIVVNSWAELKAALEANDDVQRSAARQRSTAMRATGRQIPETPYFYEDFAGKRVLLEADVVEESPVTIALEGSATIDLNGHTMKGSTDGSHSYPIVNNGNLLVVDNSDNGNGAIYCGIKTGVKFTTGDINHDAVFVMTRGNIICAHENDDDAALVNYGIAYITGGTIEGAKNAVWNEPGSKFYAKVPALIEGEVINEDGTASDIEYGVFAVAKIDNVKFGTLQKAIDAAKDGDVITLVKDVKEDVTVAQAPNVKITIDGANYTMAGTITVNGKSARYETAGLTIKNVNFDATAITKDASVRLGDGTNATRYTNNVTVENCTFTDDDYSVAAVKSYTGGDWNVQIIGCKAEGMHSLAQLANVEKGLLIQKNIANTKNGINLNQSYSAKVEDNTINVKGYAVRIGATTGGNITLTNNVLKTDNTEGDPAIVLRGTVTALNMTENAVSGDTHISGTATTLAIDANYWDGYEHPTVSGADVKVNSYYSDEARTNLVRNQVGSISAFVYAATGRISGDVTSNAAKSLLINIYGKDGNLIGTTSLENKAYLSGTPKKLTWRINLGADDSDSWKMTWYEGAPSIDNLPAKVELVVDDAKVAEAEIKLTAGGDGKSPVFAAKADAKGKILSFIACEGKFNLNDANSLLQSVPQAGDHIAILVPGTYSVPTGKNLTITGAVEGVKFDMSKAVAVHSSMTFNYVTFEYSSNANYRGLQHAGTMVYNNCTFNGQVTLYGASETFNGCTFNQAANQYNVWTYGAKDATFNYCTFESAGKSVLIYAEGASIFNNVNVNNATFKASQTVDGKAAIEIDTELTAGTLLNITNSTVDGFAAGNVSGNSLWNNKKGDGTDANKNNDITVIVDGVTVLWPKYQAKIGDTKYKYLADAMKNVKNGETITLMENYEGDITFTQAPDVKITFDGDNKEFDGTITVDGKSAAYATAGLTIKNVKFLADGITKDASINLGGSNAIRYTSNVTVEGCTFTGTNKDKVGIKSYTGGDKNLTITNCFATGMHSLAQVKNVTGVTVSGCTIDNSKNGIALGQSTNVAINGGTIEVDGYGIRVDATQATTMTVTDAQIEANIPVVARKATGDYNIDFNGDNTFTANNADGLWLAIGQEELYDTDNNITTDNLGAATGNMIVTTNDNFNAVGANVIGAVAHLGNKHYTKLQEAINACVEGDNAVEILAAIVEDVTIVQQEGINVVLKGNDKAFDGTIYIEGQSRNEGAETLTIQNVNFTTSEASHYFIDSNSTEPTKRYAHNVTIEGCKFTATGEAVNTAVAARIRQGFDIKFVGGEFTGLHSVLQGYGIAGVELDGVKAVSCKNGAALGTSTNAVVKNVDFDCAGYGIRVDASVATTLTVEESTIKAMIPVVGRKATDDYNIVFNGTNEFEANNGDNNVWCVVGAEEYGDVTLDKVGAVTGDATVTLNDTGLNKAGIHAVKATIGKVCYFSFADALAAAKTGDAIKLLADVEATEVILLDKSITIDGNDHKVTSNATRVFRVTTSDTKVTLNDVNMVSRTVMVYPNDIRGISIDAGLQNVELTLNNCSVDFTQSSANDWTYAVNISGNGTGHKLTVNGGTYEGANVINVHGANNTVTVKDATLTSLYPANDVYYGAAIWVLQKQNSSVEATGNTFEGNHAIAFNLGTGTVLNESNNTDNTKLYVAKADADKYYYTFADAVAAAENTVKLLFDQTDKGVVIDKNVTIDFNGKTYTVNKTVGSAGTTTLGFQILKDNNVTLKNGTLTSTATVEGSKEVKMLVQNYANLTVDNMKLVDATDHILYVLSNNSGTVNVVNGSEITTDAIALDACKYASYEAPTVTVAEGVKVTGNVEASAALNFAGTLNGSVVINGVDGKVTTTTVEGKNVTTTVAHYNVIYADGAYALVHKIYVAEIGANQYESFAEALDAVQNGETIELTGVEGSEVATEINFDKAISFTITGDALKYALPVVTFQNATVTIKDAEILIPELDARQNATINVVNSTVHDAGGNSIAKSYYNGTINIDKTSTVYMMQVTTMGYINVAGTLNATWQTNVYGNGMISLAEGAKFNTAALHLTGKDYSGRDNTAADRVGKPATIVVDAATLNVGKVYSDNGADYSYNSSKGINVGTVDGKLALLDIKNGGAVNFYMANGQTTNFGAGATVNVASSTLKTICRGEGTVKLANNGTVYVTGEANLDATVTGNGWFYMNGVALDADTKLYGAKVGFINGVNAVKGATVKDGFFSVGIGQNAAAEAAAAFAAANGIALGDVTVNVSENATIGGNGATYSGWVGSAYSADKTQNVYTLNINNSQAAFGYMHVSKDGVLNVDGRTIDANKYKNDGANVDFYAGDLIVNGNVTFNNADAWARFAKMSVDHADGVLNINGDAKFEASIHNGGTSSTSLKFWKAGKVNVAKTATMDIDNGTVLVEGAELNIAGYATAKGAITGNGAINFTEKEAKLAAQEGLTINHDFGDSYKVERINGVYGIYHYVASVDDVNYESLKAALQALTDGATLTLLEDITEEAWACHTITANNVTINGNDHTLTYTGEVNDGDNYNGIFRFENNMAVKNLTIDASQATGIERGISAKLGITVDNCEFIGKGNGYAVIFGEGAEVTDLANVEVSITNSTFTNWSKGVSDNANGEDAKNVSIANNIFTNASVNVSASEYVNFTKNTVEGGDVIITSYSNAVNVKVQATTNELEEGRTYQIISNPTNIVPQAEFSVPVARIDTKYYLTLQEAVNVDNSTIILVDNIRLAEAVVVEGKTATLDLNNKWIRPVDNSVTMTGGLIRLHEGANLTINDNGKDKKGEIYTNGNHNVYAAVSVLGNDAHLTVNGGKLTGYYYGIAGNGNVARTTVTINGGEIASVDADDAAGIYHPQAGTLTVTGGTITGATGIYFKGGKLDIQGGTIKGTGDAVDYEYNGSGFIATGDALVIENAEANGYAAISGISITGGTFISEDEDAAPIASYGDSKLVEFLGEGCYALFNNTFDESLLVVGYQLKDDDNDGFYGVKWTNYRQSMVFVDGEFTEYTHTQDMTVGELTYIRNIGPSWNAIYLPFEIPMSMMADYDVTYINDIRQSDTDKDGEVDKLFVEQIYIVNPNATLKANYPYIIRPKTTAAQEFKITLNNGDKGVILYAATNTELTCSSILAEYKFTGNTRTLDASELAGKYALGFDGIWYHSFSSMKPFRMYFEINERAGAPVKLSSNLSISMRPYGEEQEDGTTLIYDVEYDNETVDYIYDVQGRRVLEPQKGGIYIINGKKVVF